MATQSSSPGQSVSKYEKYSTRMQFEHSLINNRITWLLVSQGLLFSAYSNAFQKYEETLAFRNTVAGVGIAISILAAIAIVASVFAKYYTWSDLRKDDVYAAEQFWVRTPVTWVAAITECAIPVVFILAWVAL